VLDRRRDPTPINMPGSFNGPELEMSCRRGEWVCRAAQVSAPPLSREHAGRLVLQGAFRDGVGRLACSFPGRLSKPRRSGNAERIGTGAGADAHESDLAASEGAYELGLTEE
jgi:hypothetical protein